MEAVGRLAGGVAHDFNNILTVVLGSAALAQRGLPTDSPAAAYLDQIEQAGRRAAELCRQMLAYAGRGQGSSGRTELAALIREAAPLLEIPAGRRLHPLGHDAARPVHAAALRLAGLP